VQFAVYLVLFPDLCFNGRFSGKPELASFHTPPVPAENLWG